MNPFDTTPVVVMPDGVEAPVHRLHVDTGKRLLVFMLHAPDFIGGIRSFDYDAKRREGGGYWLIRAGRQEEYITTAEDLPGSLVAHRLFHSLPLSDRRYIAQELPKQFALLLSDQ